MGNEQCTLGSSSGTLKRVCEKEGIERSRKPIGCTLDDHGDQKVERETGVVVPGTKRHVEFVYRLAKPV
jgi:hypothetical protein